MSDMGHLRTQGFNVRYGSFAHLTEAISDVRLTPPRADMPGFRMDVR